MHRSHECTPCELDYRLVLIKTDCVWGALLNSAHARARADNEVSSRAYHRRRCFVSCETATTADSVVRGIAEAIHCHIESNSSSESARHRLLSYLKPMTGIICLDNMETPWDADTAAVEVLLSEIASCPSIALMITSRVMDTPLIGWSSPPLPPVEPFSVEAALQTWDAICTGHDGYAAKIIKAVGCVPLAVTLLARLARTECTEYIWTRWEHERIELIQSRGISHRLNNVSVSIELSVQALRSQEAIDVLSMLRIFSHAVRAYLFPMFDDAFEGRLSFERAIVLLTQSSLVSSGGPQPIEYQLYEILSPVRDHSLRHHPISDEYLLLFIKALDRMSIRLWLWDPIFKFGLRRQGVCRELCA